MPEDTIREDSFETNVFQVVAFTILVGVFGYFIPFLIIGGIKAIQTNQNLIIFSFYGVLGIIFALIIAILQLTEKIRAGTRLEWLDSFIHDPSKSLLYELAEKEGSTGFLNWLNSAALMFLISLLVAFLFATITVVSGTTLINYNLPPVQSNIQGAGEIYLKGSTAPIGESIVFNLFLTPTLLALARKGAGDNTGLLILFSVFMILLSTAIAGVSHLAVYGGNEKALLSASFIFLIGNIVVALTGSGIFPVIFHSIYNAALDAKIIYLTNEATLVFFMIVVTVIIAMATALYVSTIHPYIKRNHATTA